VFQIRGKDFISEEDSNSVVEVSKIDITNMEWKKIAELLNLKLIDPCLSLYENIDGIFVLGKYGFVKQIK